MLTSRQVADLVGATYRQLDYWSKLGVLQPDGEGGGSGSRRSWPATEIRIAKVLAAYSKVSGPTSGSPAYRKDIAEAIREAGPKAGWVIITPETAAVVPAGDRSWVESGAAVVVVLEALASVPPPVATDAVGLN